MYEPVVEIEKLFFSYDCDWIIKNLTLKIFPGNIYLLQGANGIGKSSFLKLIAGILKPVRGNIRNSCDYIYIGHENALVDNLSVIDVLYSDINCELSLKELIEMTDACLPFNKYSLIGDLSSGQKRRVALMRLLICTRKLWILDEPFTALDNQSKIDLLQLMEKHRDNGGVVILSSHEPLPIESELIFFKN